MNDILSEADITIIGAGVVGLAIAAEVAREGRKVYLIEKNKRFGEEQSSRNSGVIHAGIYYGTKSLKKDLCIEGNRLLYQICENHGIAHNKCGKILVATGKAEEAKAEELYKQGLENGVRLEIIDKKKLKSMEPNIAGVSALFSADTGIIDAYGLMKYFHNRALDNGAQVVYQSEVKNLEVVPGGYKVSIGSGANNFAFTTRVLINSAGLHCDSLTEKLGMDINKLEYKIHWYKGEFYSVSGGRNKLMNHLIYPVPMKIRMDIHVCYDTDWRLRLGPLFYFVKQLDYSMDESFKKDFIESVIFKALPFLEPEYLSPETSGIMATLQGYGDEFRDFVIRHEDDRGFPCLINLIGIDSPGLTGSPAIALYVSKLVDRILDS